MIGIFSLPSRWFAWFEYFTAILKVIALFIFMVAGFAMILGAGPQGYVHHGETWHDGMAFRNNFKGFSNSLLLAILAIGGKQRSVMSLKSDWCLLCS
jgi:yeast amino acid transporter